MAGYASVGPKMYPARNITGGIASKPRSQTMEAYWTASPALNAPAISLIPANANGAIARILTISKPAMSHPEAT